MSIYALSGEDLELAGIRDGGDLAITPPNVMFLISRAASATRS